jgi:anti-sigma28 factor (negative regulator of flagellin synthesis)
MSIRIQNDQTADVASTSAQRTEQTARFASGGSKSGSAIPRDGEDQVEVSSTASSIGAAVSAQNTARSNRVQQLGALYTSGLYSADSLKTSQALVSGALGAAGASHL